MVWGAVTCTWFGLQPEQLPEWIVALSVPPISNAYADVQWLPFWTTDTSSGTLGTAQNLQIFCFTLALIQLCVAHLKGMARYIKDKAHRLKFLGEFGSFVQLIGMYWVVLSMVVDGNVFPLMGGDVYGLPWGTISIAMVGGGFAFSFVFANYEGSVGKSILESVKNIISVLLGVVNVFSDIVSYIRLWAVGLAGAAISGTVNTFAGPLVGHAALFIVLIILLVFGHGLNMILNLLSVIVHGVRLNTLEFSNHLGMSWAGFKYEPLKE
jgi:V/A-type H+-transporting ATPase subunit I